MRKGNDVATLQPLEILGTIANGRQVGVRGEADRNTPAARQQFLGELVGRVDGSVFYRLKGNWQTSSRHMKTFSASQTRT